MNEGPAATPTETTHVAPETAEPNGNTPWDEAAAEAAGATVVPSDATAEVANEAGWVLVARKLPLWDCAVLCRLHVGGRVGTRTLARVGPETKDRFPTMVLGDWMESMWLHTQPTDGGDPRPSSRTPFSWRYEEHLVEDNGATPIEPPPVPTGPLSVIRAVRPAPLPVPGPLPDKPGRIIEQRLHDLETAHVSMTLGLLVEALGEKEMQPTRALKLIEHYAVTSRNHLRQLDAEGADGRYDDDDDDDGYVGFGLGRRGRRGRGLVHGGAPEPMRQIMGAVEAMGQKQATQQRAAAVRDLTAALRNAQDMEDAPLAAQVRAQLDVALAANAVPEEATLVAPEGAAPVAELLDGDIDVIGAQDFEDA